MKCKIVKFENYPSSDRVIIACPAATKTKFNLTGNKLKDTLILRQHQQKKTYKKKMQSKIQSWKSKILRAIIKRVIAMVM